MNLPSAKFVKNATLVGVGSIFGQMLGFLFLTIVARWMTKNEYGEIQYIISISTFAAAIVASGLPTSMTRFLSKNSDDQEKQNTYYTNTMIIFLFTLCMTMIFAILIFPGSPIIAVIILGYSVPLLYFGVVRGLMQYQKFSIAQATKNVVNIVFLFLIFYAVGITNENVLIIYAFGSWLAILILEAIWPSKVKFNKRVISKKTLKEITIFSIPVMITTIAYTFVMTGIVIVLKWYWDYEVVASLSTAFVLTIIYGVIPYAILTMTMPKISSSKDINKKMEIFKKSVIIIAISGVLLFLATLIFGQWALKLVFTDKYETTYWPLVIISLSMIFAGVRNAFSSLWEGGGVPRISTYDTVGACIAAIITAFVLIPKYGAVGGAWAFTVGWIAAVFISGVYFIRFKQGKLLLT